MAKNSAVTDSHVNIVFNILQAVQKEKSVHLEELISERKCLEVKKVEAYEKYREAYRQSGNTLWNLKIIKSKTENMELIVKRFEERNNSLKTSGEEFEFKIKNFVEERSKAVTEFEEQLEYIKSNFLEAQNYYTEDVLNEEIQSVGDKISTIEKEEAIADQRLKTLSEEIKSVYETHEFKPISSDTFTSTTLALQVKLIEEENRSVAAYLKELNATLQSLEMN